MNLSYFHLKLISSRLQSRSHPSSYHLSLFHLLSFLSFAIWYVCVYLHTIFHLPPQLQILSKYWLNKWTHELLIFFCSVHAKKKWFEMKSQRWNKKKQGTYTLKTLILNNSGSNGSPSLNHTHWPKEIMDLPENWIKTALWFSPSMHIKCKMIMCEIIDVLNGFHEAILREDLTNSKASLITIVTDNALQLIQCLKRLTNPFMYIIM